MVRFFAAVPSLKHRTALMAAYAAGLGGSEVVRLRIADYRLRQDADPGRRRQGPWEPVRHAVGAAACHAHWREARPEHWLFPGRDGDRPFDVSTLRVACNARRAARLGKLVPVHTLRHGYVTHLLEAGTDSSYPGAARPPASVDHRALYPSRDDHDRQHDQPVRPAGMRD